ncbi:MAG TPA: hypothetical protein VLB76_16580 [Thermoanaerobaculia bacterium]|jgi:hypothetical protein|nr:hypothetical protein [Thermoanaerobaculia bacterium]
MPLADASTLDATARLFWRRIPGAAARLSETLRTVLRDGDYLLAWPAAAALAPPLVLLFGLLLGAAHPGLVFSSSLPVLLLLAAVGGFGSSLGLLAAIGYAFGDLLLHGHEGMGYAYGVSRFGTLLRTDLALVNTYVILAGLLVVTPLVATSVRRHTQTLVRSGSAGFFLGFLAGGLVQALLAYFWAQSAAFMIRPVWSFWSRAPDIGSINPLQHGAPWIALVTLLAVAGRAVLTLKARQRPAPPNDRPYVRFSMRRPWPWQARVVLRSALFTLLLAGLFSSLLEAGALFVLLAGLGVLQYRVVPAMQPYVAIVNRIPLLIRIAACGGGGFLMAALVVQPAINRGSASFLPMVVAVIPPLLLAAFVLPKPAGGSGR